MRQGFVPTGARAQPRLLIALIIDALGTGLFIPLSLLFFVATTPLSLARVGVALSVAALIRIPATIASGPFIDRVGPRAAVVTSLLLQAAGFVNYLFVGSFWYVVGAAALVQVGNSLFWVAYQALVSQVADAESREHWFALCSAMRTAGVAIGGVGAGVAIATGGHGGYLIVVMINAVSFVVAAALIWRPQGRPDPPLLAIGDENRAPVGWRIVLADRPFLWFVLLAFGFAFLSLAFALAVPVYLVKVVGLPLWLPGVVLALNAVLGTAGVPYVMRSTLGRARSGVLTTSQSMVGPDLRSSSWPISFRAASVSRSSSSRFSWWPRARSCRVASFRRWSPTAPRPARSGATCRSTN